jgi:2-oxoglutarate dehydrogenase complex dehydrogenase (E1) component-like enzyme
MKKLYDRYYPSLEAINKDLKTSNEKTPKETDNWLSQEEIKSKFDELKTIYTELMETKSKKITEAQYNKLLDLVVLGLYVLQRPRRNMDYQDMVVTTLKAKAPKTAKAVPVPVPAEPETKETKTMSNVLNLADNKFEFNNYKTKGCYLLQTESLDLELRQIIDLYLKYHPLAKEMKKEAVPFIVSFDGKAFTNNNDFTRLLYKIFGKKIGVSMLRKIFLTDKYKETLDELKSDSQAMGTSTSTIQDHYIKE